MTALSRTFVPLESGDRLTREEFHQRYCLRPDIRKAELIDGVVYVPSPARNIHGRPHALVLWWLGGYAALAPGVDVTAEVTVFLSEESEVQPDAVLYRVGPGATLKENDDHYLEGAPELVVEIAASSAAYDLNTKKDAYRRAGVKEYIVWQIFEASIIWFGLTNGEYVRLEPDEHGVIESRVFPGLRLNVPRMLAFDRTGVSAELRPPGGQTTSN